MMMGIVLVLGMASTACLAFGCAHLIDRKLMGAERYLFGFGFSTLILLAGSTITYLLVHLIGLVGKIQ